MYDTNIWLIKINLVFGNGSECLKMKSGGELGKWSGYDIPFLVLQIDATDFPEPESSA